MKYKIILLLMLAFALVACGSADNETPEEEGVNLAETSTDAIDEAPETESVEEAEEAPFDPEPEPTDEPTEVPTEVPTNEPEPTTEPEEEAEAEADEAASDVPASIRFAPASTPEEANVLRPDDYFKGASDPDVVLIEYGDFQ